MNAHRDIVVVGSGAAGVAAAVMAARAGAGTLLLDQRAEAGGTGGFSGLTTLGGLFDDEGEFLNEGFPREFGEALAETPPVRMGKVWVLPYRPERFRRVAMDFLTALPNLEIRWSTSLGNVVAEGDCIVRLDGCSVGAVIDASGTAEVARAVGAACLATDETTQAPAVIFPLHNVRREFTSPAEAVQVLLPLARAGLPPLNFQAGLEPETLTVKFTGHAAQVTGVIEFLRAHVAGFEQCWTSLTTFTPVHRAGRMVVGPYVLTGADVLEGRKFPDAVTRGAWPVEQWGVKSGARYRYLPPGVHYDIPARCLCAASVSNLFMAGKTISADADAIASARVMGCCLATGAAAGELAVRYLKSSNRP